MGYSIKQKNGECAVYFFQIAKQSQTIFPSLLLLRQFPNFLPCILVYSPVSKFILRGADLMLPGVAKTIHSKIESGQLANKMNAKCLSKVRVNELFCIKVIGNALPFAIGYSLLSSAEICASDSSKGRFVKTVHIFRDQLWTFAGKIKPNSGFLSDVVNAVQIEK